MLLDEPTNHLDVYTREALEAALERFTGALIVVSHDRYFIDRVAENVIVVDGGVADVFPGNYSDHVLRVKEGIVVPRPAPAPPPEPLRHSTPVAVSQHGQRTEQRKSQKRIKKIDEEIGLLEERIASAERERERNDLLLCSEEVFRDGERVKKIRQRNDDLKSMIELLYGKWEALSKEKEELQTGAAV